MCVESVLKTAPALRDIQDSIEQLSRNCFYKIHVRKLPDDLSLVESIGAQLLDFCCSSLSELVCC